MQKLSILKTSLFLRSLFLVALLSACSQEETTAPQQHIETVSIQEALDFLKSQSSSELAKSDTEPYASFSVKQLTQEKLSNSAASLTIIPATTSYKDHYSRLLLLKINAEVQGVLFSMYPSAASTEAQFSGELIITDLDGGFLNGYRVSNGSIITQFVKGDSSNVAQKTSNVVCPDHGDCVAGSNCVFCLQELDEVVVTGGSGGTGGIIPITGLYDYDAMEPGGGTGPDMGMGWDYGPGGGASNENEEKVCINSFIFTNVGGNWQNAGLSNVNVQFITLGNIIALQNVHFPELHFGLPKLRANGDYITNNNARYIAQEIMTHAEQLTDAYQSINPTSTALDLKNYFLNRMQELAGNYGGTVGTSAPLGWMGQLQEHQTYFISESWECE